jgi:AcrR family transcriptional regulator
MDSKTRSARPKQPVTRRLPPESRRQVIIEQAIRFFAEKGFGATTRELAQRIGVTQPLLFQYFPTKQDLIDTVFDALFERMSSRDWRSLIDVGSRPLRERLIDFFHLYATDLYDYHWIRIYMFAGLEGGAFNRLCITRITEPLLRQVAVMIRREYGIGPYTPAKVTRKEIEVLWLLHGGIYYSAIRKQIYGMAVESSELRSLIEFGVDATLTSMRHVLNEWAAQPARRSAPRAPKRTVVQEA